MSRSMTGRQARGQVCFVDPPRGIPVWLYLRGLVFLPCLKLLRTSTTSLET